MPITVFFHDYNHCAFTKHFMLYISFSVCQSPAVSLFLASPESKWNEAYVMYIQDFQDYLIYIILCCCSLSAFEI